MRGNETQTWRGMQRLAGVGPTKGMGHGDIIIAQEFSQLVFEIGDAGETSAEHNFAIHNAEHNFNLIQPRTMLRRVHEPHAVRQFGEKRATTRHVFQNA